MVVRGVHLHPVQAAKEAVPDVVSSLAIARRRQRLLISADIPLISALGFVSITPCSCTHQQAALWWSGI